MNIKIRAWNISTNKFLTPLNRIHLFWNNNDIRKCDIIFEDSKDIIWNLFINKKDINDVDIYVGDIVKVINKKSGRAVLCEVGDDFLFYKIMRNGELFREDLIFFDVIVIGNKYENPDLMNSKIFNKELIFQEDVVIFCKFQHEAISLCNWLYEIGEKWCNNTPYIYTNWERYKENTCYSPSTGSFSTLEYYKDKCIKIIPFENILKEK